MQLNPVKLVVAVDARKITAYGGQSSHHSSSRAHGPMVDSGASYSAIGVAEHVLICSFLKKPTISCYDPLSAVVSHYQWCQYGSEKRSSCCGKIIGSVMLACCLDSNKITHICNLVVEESLQWIVGYNFTRKSNHTHISDNRAQLLATCEAQD